MLSNVAEGAVEGVAGKDRTGTEVEVERKAEGDHEGQTGGDKSKSASKKGVNGDGGVKDEKLGGNDEGNGIMSKRKGKDGDNSAVSNNENGGSSKSRSSKRQKRQAGSEVT